jgi:HTH-type transcriptional regulator/antitoxin HigA
MEPETEMKTVVTRENHAQILEVISAMMERDLDSVESLYFDFLVDQTVIYERDAFPLAVPDPVDCILFRMDQMGWTRADVAHLFGGRSHASEVLNRKRPLSMAMIQRVSSYMGIPIEDLMSQSPALPNSDNPKEYKDAHCPQPLDDSSGFALAA